MVEGGSPWTGRGSAKAGASPSSRGRQKAVDPGQADSASGWSVKAGGALPQADQVQASVAGHVEAGDPLAGAEIDRFGRLHRPAAGVEVADPPAVEEDVQDAVAVEVGHGQRLGAFHGDGQVAGGLEDRPAAAVPIGDAVQPEASAAVGGEHQLGLAVAVEVAEGGVRVGAGEGLQPSRAGLPEAQPHRVAEVEPAALARHPRMADDAGARLPGPVVVVPGAGQVRPAVAVEVGQAEAVQGHGPGLAGVVAQQVAGADGGGPAPGGQVGPAAPGRHGVEADLVAGAGGVAHRELDAALVAVGELLGQVAGHGRSVGEVDHLDRSRVQEPFAAGLPDHRAEVESGRDRDRAQVLGQGRGDGEGHGDRAPQWASRRTTAPDAPRRKSKSTPRWACCTCST